MPNGLHSDVFDLIRKGWDVNTNSRADANGLLNHEAFNLIGQLFSLNLPVAPNLILFLDNFQRI